MLDAENYDLGIDRATFERVADSSH